MQSRFSPEQLGIQASSALAYTIFELIVYSITLYVANIPTTLKTLDLLAYSGYKYSIIVACILTSLIFHKMGYYLSLLYCGLTLAVFLVSNFFPWNLIWIYLSIHTYIKFKLFYLVQLRALKSKVFEIQQQTADTPSYDNYGNQQFDQSIGRKRKLYFLFLVAGCQPLLCFWLSVHLIPVSLPIEWIYILFKIVIYLH